MTEHPQTRSNSAVASLNDLRVVPGFEPWLHGHGLDSLDALFLVRNDGQLGKPGLSPWRERLRIELTSGGDSRTFYLKRFTDPPRDAQREVRRSGAGARSAAGVEWTWMHRLADDGIACVRPVAMGEELCGQRELRSAILTEAVPGKSLEQWVTLWTEADRPQALAMVEPLAELVARLHQGGYVHRDLYLSHIFHEPKVSRTPEPTAGALTLIDLQRIFRPKPPMRRWIVKDLAALNFSTPEALISRTRRIRWLTRYLGTRKLDGQAKRLVYEIVGKTQRIAAHERRRRVRQQQSGGA